MEAAAEHLTPVTLELGGKSPAIVTDSRRPRGQPPAASRGASSSTPARRASPPTTCSSPSRCTTQFVAELATRDHDVLRRRPGDVAPTTAASSTTPPLRPPHGLLDRGGYDKVAVGGEHDADTRYIAPTVLTGVKPDAAVMHEEIFGPILPVLAVRQLDDAIAFVNDRPKPLALYVFGSRAVADRPRHRAHDRPAA